VGILARLAALALAMAYDMAATQALQSDVSGCKKKVSGECCGSKRAYWRRNVTAAEGEAEVGTNFWAREREHAPIRLVEQSSPGELTIIVFIARHT
jgi:hypothetical protein